MKTNAYIGIDFGTSTCCTAWYDPQTDRAEVISNAEGEPKTPSVLYYDQGKTLVGAIAEQLVDSPESRRRVVRNIKRRLASDEVKQFGDRTLTMVEMAAAILEKIRTDAENGHFHGQGVKRLTHAVITYPASFDQSELDGLLQAAHLAGFETVEFLHEPVAAAIAYSRQGLAVGQHVFVYDLGGGTFDLALLIRDEKNVFRLGMEPISEKRGGEDFDRLIYNHFELQIRQQTQNAASKDGIDPQLLRECRKIKEMLSRLDEWQWSWNSNNHGAIPLKIHRNDFEKLIEKDIDKTVKITRNAIRDAEDNNQKVESVILIGGSSRIPLIERKLREALPILPLKWSKQDVAVALGAAYHAAALWGGAPATTGIQDRSFSNDLLTTPLVGTGSSSSQSFFAARPEEPSRKDLEPSDEAQSLVAMADDFYQKSSTTEDNDPNVQEAQKQQLLSQALTYAQAACDLEPRWPDPFFSKALILMSQSQFAIASATWTVVLRLNLSNEASALAYFHRGRCKAALNDQAGAKGDFDLAIGKQEFAMAHWQRGLSRWFLGDVNGCAEDLELYLQQDENFECATVAVLGMIELKEKTDPAAACELFKHALAQYPTTEDLSARLAFHREVESFNLLDRVIQTALPEYDSIVLTEPVRSMQKLLLTACWKLSGSSPQSSAGLFLESNSHPIHEEAWINIDKLIPLYFALHCFSSASIPNDRGVFWLRYLLNIQPLYDIRILQRDKVISTASSQSKELKNLLTPTLVLTEEHGAFSNYVQVTNNSSFAAHSITVNCSWNHSTQGAKKQTYTLNLLESGKSHWWNNAFPDGGFFGGNVTNIQLSWTCDEKQGQFT